MNWNLQRTINAFPYEKVVKHIQENIDAIEPNAITDLIVDGNTNLAMEAMYNNVLELVDNFLKSGIKQSRYGFYVIEIQGSMKILYGDKTGLVAGVLYNMMDE